MPKLVEKEKCTGCGACFNRCNNAAISMIPDKTGFLYPCVDMELCTECGMCEKVCPVLDKVIPVKGTPYAYIVQNKDKKIRKESTSGGVFSAIAAEVIRRGGVVFGAAFGDDFYVEHTSAFKIEEVQKFRSSKYVQSDTKDCFKKAEYYLKEGRWVLYSGTPCQIHGLKCFLKMHYSRLITVDVMCRAVPSPLIFHKYLDYQQKRLGKFERVVFRDKLIGYSYSQMAIYRRIKDDRPIYFGGSEYDPWLRLFLGGFCNRECCKDCHFQTGYRISDITLWDCWRVRDLAPQMDDNLGTTSAIAWTKMGQELLTDDKLTFFEMNEDKISTNLEREALSIADISLKEFYQDAKELSAETFIQKYVPISLRVRMKRLIRILAFRLHIHDIIRRYIHGLRKKRRILR